MKKKLEKEVAKILAELWVKAFDFAVNGSNLILREDPAKYATDTSLKLYEYLKFLGGEENK